MKKEWKPYWLFSSFIVSLWVCVAHFIGYQVKIICQIAYKSSGTENTHAHFELSLISIANAGAGSNEK